MIICPINRKLEESQMDKLTFLKKFRKDLEIIDINQVENTPIPEIRRKIFGEGDFSGKKEIV